MRLHPMLSSITNLKHAVSVLALAATSLPVIAVEPSMLDIDGVRLGMGKAEAIAALKRSRPGISVEEIYAGHVQNHGYVTLPKQRLRPADVDIFAELSVGPKDEQLGCPTGLKTTAPRINTRVLFSADLKDPRVVYVEKYLGHCGDSIPVKTAIGELLAKYSTGVSRAQNIDLALHRLNSKKGFLEWRFGATGRIINSMGTNREFNIENIPTDLGNANGGIVFHARVESEPGDVNYLGTVELYLWDDARMATHYGDQGAVLQRMNSLGVGVGDLSNPRVIEQLVLPPKPVPESPAMWRPMPTAATGKPADAVVSLPPATMHPLLVSTEFELPAGSWVMELLPKEAAPLAKMTRSTPHVWMKFDRRQCFASTGALRTWNPSEFPCGGEGAILPIPADAMDQPTVSTGPAGEPRRLYQTTRALTVAKVTRKTYLENGVKLYRAEVAERPIDLGFWWPDDKPYTWFNVDPSACVDIAKRPFDCSRPIPLPNEDWKPADKAAGR